MNSYVRRLRLGDKVGFFSPSFPASVVYPKRFARAYNFLSKDFEVVLGFLTSNEGKRRNYLAGSRYERAAEFNELLNECACLMSIIGGYNSSEILELIDYKKVLEKKPIVIGFSDSCAICLAIYAKTGIPTFVSQAVVPTYGEFPPFVNYNYKYFLEMLVNKQDEKYLALEPMKEWTEDFKNWEEYDSPKERLHNKWEFYREGYAKGILIGGNLDTMCALIGTGYMPNINTNTILMIEESLLTLPQIARNLYTLKLHGVFEKIAGLIVAKFEKINYLDDTKDEYDIINEVIGNRCIPILKKFDNGHTHPSTLLPVGGVVEIDSFSNTVKVNTDSVFMTE